MLFHGLFKASHGVEQIGQMLQQHGLPGAIAYLAYVGEIVAPLFLIAGAWVTPAAAVIAVNMLVAIALAHAGDLARLNEQGGWAIELQVFYLGTAIALVLTGGGRIGLFPHKLPAYP